MSSHLLQAALSEAISRCGSEEVYEDLHRKFGYLLPIPTGSPPKELNEAYEDRGKTAYLAYLGVLESHGINLGQLEWESLTEIVQEAWRETAKTLSEEITRQCARVAASQAPDVDDTGNGDEYRRGQKRGALDAAEAIGKGLSDGGAGCPRCKGFGKWIKRGRRLRELAKQAQRELAGEAQGVKGSHEGQGDPDPT